MALENPITCVASIVHKLAADLSHADRQEVISASLVRISTGTEHALSAVRWSLADWLRDQTTIPAPVDDIDLKREMQRARRAVRSASEDELQSWDKLLGRMTEREREVAIRLAAGFGRRDIAADCGLSDGTVTRTVKAIRRRLGDSVLWFPILDALYSLPNTKAERAEYVTDLREYRRVRVARRSAPIVAGETAVQIRTWKRASADNLSKTELLQTAVWYPGACRRLTTGIDCSAPRTRRTDFRRPLRHGAYAVVLLPDNQQTKDEHAEISLRRREAIGLASGNRWFFEHRKHGTMLRVPVIRREFDANGMFRSHCS